MRQIAKTMFARERSRGAGSEARGEGMERGNSIELIETTSRPFGNPAGWWDFKEVFTGWMFLQQLAANDLGDELLHAILEPYIF